MDILEKQKKLTLKLIEASRAYYAQDTELMSNLEYDRLCDELAQMEAKTGVILSGSPSVTVGYEAVDELPKEDHESPMLSLSKTKDRDELAGFLKGHPGVLSWKLDGLTIVLTYDGGQLTKAVTRGNGTTGEVITPNARTFVNIPGKIPYMGRLVIRGEAVITYSDFELINSRIEDGEAKYKNPRNLCSGSVRQLDSSITAQRHVRFYAFALVSTSLDDPGEALFGGTPGSPALETAGDSPLGGTHLKAPGQFTSRMAQFEFLKSQGFDVVEHYPVTGDDIGERISYFEQAIQTHDIPSDGLVLILDEIEYGKSLGTTAKFPRDAMAFKWADEQAITTLKYIEWSASRTGLINPVAVFEPVELEGTTVSRASVHNVSILRSLSLGEGDEIKVYKANMIIPQISENLTKSGTCEPPAACPVCGSPTAIKTENGVETLFCTNPDCAAKHLKAFTLFVSRDALNVDGLSEATLEKFIGAGFIHSFCDLFRLGAHADTIITMEGFGEKSCKKLLDSIERAKNTTLPRLLYGLGIEGIGSAGAKLLCKSFNDDPGLLIKATTDELSSIDGIGPVLAGSIRDYFDNEKNLQQLNELLGLLNIERALPSTEGQSLLGMSFVVTGSLNIYENRDSLKARIEALGGKLTGSVTGKTVALVNNDTTSTSSKNKKARELGVRIISEEDFIKEFLNGF